MNALYHTDSNYAPNPKRRLSPLEQTIVDVEYKDTKGKMQFDLPMEIFESTSKYMFKYAIDLCREDNNI